MYPYLFFLPTHLFHSIKPEIVRLCLSTVTSSIYVTDSSPPFAFSTDSSSFPDHSNKHKNILTYGLLKKPSLTRPPITLHPLPHLSFSHPPNSWEGYVLSLLSSSYSVHADDSSLTAVPLLHWSPSCKSYQWFLYCQITWSILCSLMQTLRSITRMDYFYTFWNTSPSWHCDIKFSGGISSLRSYLTR